MFSYKDKIAVITGGGSGIGKAVSELFAKQGATVHILELNKEQAQQTLDTIGQYGGEAYSYACDVSNQSEVQRIIGDIGKIDILVNCAGIAHIGKADTTNEGDFTRIFNVNVKGVYNCLHVAIPLFK